MATAISHSLFLLLALGFLQTASAKPFEVKSGNETCILAIFEAKFVISYETIDKRKVSSSFSLPENATVNNNSSSCNNLTIPRLVISFGDGHSISMNFSKDSTTYRMEALSVSYNTNDSSLFPNATSGGLITAVSTATDIGAKMNTMYKCFSGYTVHMQEMNVTMSNIQMEAFLTNNTFSKNETVCGGDLPTTLPTTIPTTTSTPTTSPPPNPRNPAPRTYNISGVNETCLLAQMGLQLNITYTTKDNKMAEKVFNIQPNITNSNGNCSRDRAFLQLTDDSTVLTFLFVVNTTSKKFYLKEVSVITNLTLPSAQMNFNATNTSLTYLQTSVGKSYMCRAKQTLQVTPDFSINAFQFHIQLFKINNGKFGPAEECKLDQDNMLIPIIVGAALAGLVLIVLIAYLIGRKRSHAGYQTI